MPAQKFSLVPGFQVENFTLDSLEQLTRILRKYHIQTLKFTSTHRLGLIEPTPEELEHISQELQPLSAPRKNSWITSIQSCPGKNSCRHGIRDAETLARRIEKIELSSPLQARVKVGIAGCRRCCTEPYVRDIGLIPESKGWSLTFGGNGGGKPRIGDVIAEGLTDDQAVELIRRCLTMYQENAGPKMRTARFIESFGLQEFSRVVLAQPLTETAQD